MAVKKIMCCCGQGLGSSFLVEMNVQKVLKALGLSHIEVSHAALGEIYEGIADVFVVGSDIASQVTDKGDVIALQNIISVDELTEKLTAYFKEKGVL